MIGLADWMCLDRRVFSFLVYWTALLSHFLIKHYTHGVNSLHHRPSFFLFPSFSRAASQGTKGPINPSTKRKGGAGVTNNVPALNLVLMTGQNYHKRHHEEQAVFSYGDSNRDYLTWIAQGLARAGFIWQVKGLGGHPFPKKE
jgi:hypothetical protein